MRKKSNVPCFMPAATGDLEHISAQASGLELCMDGVHRGPWVALT